jgi:hypothetical protein
MVGFGEYRDAAFVVRVFADLACEDLVEGNERLGIGRRCETISSSGYECCNEGHDAGLSHRGGH